MAYCWEQGSGEKLAMDLVLEVTRGKMRDMAMYDG